jgi:hypothetical protein
VPSCRCRLVAEAGLIFGPLVKTWLGNFRETPRIHEAIANFSARKARLHDEKSSAGQAFWLPKPCWHGSSMRPRTTSKHPGIYVRHLYETNLPGAKSQERMVRSRGNAYGTKGYLP